jgi:hypothetical protein
MKEVEFQEEEESDNEEEEDDEEDEHGEEVGWRSMKDWERELDQEPAVTVTLLYK